jgi:hypothetical protein
MNEWGTDTGRVEHGTGTETGNGDEQSCAVAVVIMIDDCGMTTRQEREVKDTSRKGGRWVAIRIRNVATSHAER